MRRAGQRSEVEAGSGNSPPAITVRDLRVRYNGAAALALDGVGLEVQAGARVALVGPNGAGKSTLLKAILGLVPKRSGEVRIDGGSFAERRRRVAYLPQIGELDWRFPVSVRRLVTTGRYVHLGWLRWPRRADYAQVERAIERMGLTSVANRQIGELSGGQRQRALLARALVQGADILLLDEPFNAVDAESRSILVDVLDELRREGATVVLATHALDPLSINASEVVHLRDGRILAHPASQASGNEPPNGE